jgi:hydroxymethylglutaryl-CoA synthase
VLEQLFHGQQPEPVDVLVVATEHKRVRESVAKRSGIQANQVVTSVAGLGCAGAANAGLLLAHALSTATAGQRILLLALADGADALLLQVASDGALNAAPTVSQQVAAARPDLPYATYLSWRGLIQRDTGRRPPLPAPAPVPALRSTQWKYGLVGSRCLKCDAVHLPPERVCRECGSIDAMTSYPVRDQPATVLRVTTDWLAWSPQPPLIQAIVGFDGGGRLRCEVTDVFDGDLRAGDRVLMSFRVLRTVDGIRNYFWKASPAPVDPGDGGKDAS